MRLDFRIFISYIYAKNYAVKKVLSLFIFLAGLIFYSTSSLLAQSHKYNFQHLSSADGLPPVVYSVVKDHEGFMWFATINGLYRYDGKSFKSYKYHPNDTSSISGNVLYPTYLLEDKNETLWVGTNANGLNKYNKYTETFTRYKNNPNNPGSLSSNGVVKFYQDPSGIIWVATDDGLNKYYPQTDEFSVYKPDPNNLNSKSNEIASMFQDSKGLFWVGTQNGLYIFNRSTNTFQKHEQLSKIQANYKNTAIREVIEDNEGILWFGANCGLIRYNRQTNEIKYYSHDANDPKSIIDNDIYSIVVNPDNGGNVFWLASTGGLISFNRRNEQLTGYKHDPKDPNSLSSNLIWDVYLDNSGTLWISTENGVNYIHLKESPFTYYPLIVPNTNEQHSATSFCRDSNGNLWVGSHNGGLFRFDRQMQIVGHQDFGEEQKKKLAYNYVRSIYEDASGTIWLGNSGGGTYKYATEKEAFEPMPFQLDESNIVYRIFEDSFGVLWISSSLDLLQLDKPSGKIVFFYDQHNTSIKVNKNYKFYEDKEKCLWIGTAGEGVFMLRPENREKMLFINFKHDPDDPSSISSNIVNAIREDANNNLWLATSRGVNKYLREKQAFECVDNDNGIGTEYVYHLEADNNGNLFLSTENGFLKFNPYSSEKEKSKVFRIQDGLPFDEIFPYFFYKDQDGKIYVGGGKDSEKGFFVFQPDSIQQNEHIPPIAITNFKIRNEEVKLDSSITKIKQINLIYKQNYISFNFAALDYINPSKNHYAFMLEGYDDDWVYPGNRAFANYTSVPPGDYVFRVKGSNNDGKWNEQGASIGISISKPPWNSWWANAIYILIIVVLFYGWRRYDLKRQQLKQQLEIEHLESERLAELDKMKSRFFANISHEFRTPLTLIIGPIAKLIERTREKATLDDLGIIHRNATRLQKLINQLLSLTKLESGNMKLQAKEEDLVLIVKGYIQSFSALADQKEITLTFKSKKKEHSIFVDRDKLEKIMFNLLSNAFKFTNQGGEIRVSLSSYIYPKNNKHGVKIVVQDNGKGIPNELIPHIFNRFYQAEEATEQLQEGTGIGLSLTKELVKLHQGKIWVDSEIGKGSRFTVFFPFHDARQENMVMEEDEESIAKTESADNIEESAEKEHETMFKELSGDLNTFLGSDNIPIVLVVEDNTDMRTFIRGYLEETYRVIEAVNGEEGFAKAIQEIPDLVISDVMMPKMDGNQMCNKLKGDERTSHIPVILLTAKAGLDSKIEGLEAGADAYLSKPFDGKELMIRVKNLISQRQKLRDFFRGKLTSLQQSPLSRLDESGITSMDQKFVEKAIKVVEEHMTNPDFSVQFFGQEMAMSRIQLHRKLKAIVNQSASSFVRTLRLNRAALLLSKQAGNVTEVAYDVGFNNLSYFAKCFSEQFGCTPSDFAAKKSSKS